MSIADERKELIREIAQAELKHSYEVDAWQRGERDTPGFREDWTADALIAAGYRKPEAAPSDTDDREALEERIADTLAYYECRRNNPKADHPRMGYHAFSEDQRKHLREAHGEAAAEITRIVFESAGNAWDGGAKAMAMAIAEEQSVTYIAPHNPFRRTSQPVQVEVTADALSAEDRGIIIDALIQHREHALERKAFNSESTSDDRADACARLIQMLGDPALSAALGGGDHE